MANIQGQKKWSEVRLLETHELARGGVNGNLNEQAKALADRTEFLNQEKASKSEIAQGVFEFGTYAEFNAAKASLPANCTVVISEENTTGTGTWGIGNNSWNGSVLKKSSFDPTQIAKEYSDERFNEITKLKQRQIQPDSSVSLDFSAYLQVGNISSTTGLLEGQNFSNRRSIIDFPLEQGKYYNLQNLADTVSNLRVAWFSSSNKLLSISTISAGGMVSWNFTPPQNAAKVNITIKSGNTDSIKYESGTVNFYKSESQIKITKINGVDLNDSRVPGLIQSVQIIDDKLKPIVNSHKNWLAFGLGSNGLVNSEATQSHLDYFAVEAGDVLTSDTRPMFRINLYDVNKSFISQGGFTGGNSYTIPSGLGVAFVRVSMEVAYTSNTATVTRTPAKTKIDQAFENSQKNANELASKQNFVKADSVVNLDFSAYLQVGSLNSTTGLLENQGALSRRSIVGFPVEQGKYYNVQNLADSASNLYVAWFTSSNVLVNVQKVEPGTMRDQIFSPPKTATKVNIGVKSGATDSAEYRENTVNFYVSSSGFTIDRINGFRVKDPELTADVERLKSHIESDNEIYNVWNQFGLSSNGALNSDPIQSHLEYIAVEPGDVLTSDTRPMFRINLYDVNKSFISQGGFTGGSTYTIPSGLGVAFVSVSMESLYTSNNASVTRTPMKSKVEQALSLAMKSQELILPDNILTVDFSAYLQVGNISSTTGLLEGQNFSNRRSIIDFPLEQGKYYNLQNLADTVSNLRVAWFSSSNELLSISTISAGGMVSWNFTAPQNAVKVNITIKSGNTDGQPYDSNKIKFFKSTSELKVKRINGFELAGANASGTDPDAIKQVIVGGLYANKTGNIVTINSATAQQSGLMSAADKAKLDALINGTITINGSGVTKNAAAFGFLPTNNADENVTALKAAVEGGGTILIDYPGVYDINESIPLESNTLILFGAKVYINKVLFNGKSPRYTFINKGAYTREWNENIILKNLKIICNGIGNGGDGTPSIPGLRGHVAMFYIRNFELDNFELLDGDAISYVVHVCTFENIKITGPHIEGWKDAIHLGNGKTFLIRDGQFRTYDDPIALNAHDYATGQPELGWVENGLIENCYDLDDPIRGTTGYFARILAGAWVDWFLGMVVQQSDTVVASNGKMYRVSNGVGETTVYYTSTTEPSHATGTVELDGIKWTMCQDNGITHTVGVRNVKFKDIFLQKDRAEALSIHFDTGRFSRSYYPNAEMPVQENITFEGLHVQAKIPTLVSAITPLKNLKIINSEIGESKIRLKNVNTPGMVYQPLNILMMGNTFMGIASHNLVECESGRTARVKILGSIKENDGYNPTYSAGVTVLSSDL